MSDFFSTDDASLTWKEKGRRELLKTVVFSVNESESVSPNGDVGHYVVVDAPDWCIVIPEDEGDFLMVKQWRHGFGGLSVEFPGGVAEKGEKPETAAARELLEETGFRANEMIFLGSMNPNPALFSNRVHVFLARKLYKASSQKLDADEFVAFSRIPKSEVLAKMGTDEQPHALMTAALCLYLKNFAI